MRLLAIAILVFCLAPDAAMACAGCISGQTEQTRYAFLWTAGFLSVLPLGMLGILVWYLRRRMLEIDAREGAAAGVLGAAASTQREEPGVSRSASSR